MQFNPALAAAYSAAMASLNDTQPSAGGGGSSSSGGGGGGGGGSGAAAGAGGGSNAPSTPPPPPPPFPAAADPTAMLLGMQQPVGYPIVALVPVGMVSHMLLLSTAVFCFLSHVPLILSLASPLAALSC